MRTAVSYIIKIALALYLIAVVYYLWPSITKLLPYMFPQSAERTTTEQAIKPSPIDVNNWAYYIRDVKLDVVIASPFEMVVIDRFVGKQQLTKQDVDRVKVQPNGKPRKVLAYLSVGQAESYRGYWNSQWNAKRPLWIGDEDHTWKGVYDIDDISNPEWWKIVSAMLNQVLEDGYDGVVLAGVHSYKQENTLTARKKMIDFVIRISQYLNKNNKQFAVLVQDNEELTTDNGYTAAIDGIIKQDLVHTWKSNGITGPKTPVTEFNKSVELLSAFRNKGKNVFVVEYVAGQQWAAAKKLIDSNRFIGYSAPRQLNVLRIQ